MKKLVVIIIVGILAFQSCKKDNLTNEDPVGGSYCSKAKFQVSFNSSLIPSSITEDCVGNILIIGKKQGLICMVKLNSSGRLLWEKTYQNMPYNISSVVTLSDNSIILSSYQNNTREQISNQTDLNNVFIQDTIINPYYCTPSFTIGNFHGEGYNVKSKSYLTKFDNDGNIVWQNNYDECIGNANSIIVNKSGNINMVTMKLKGYVPILVFDNNGVFQDSIKYPLNDNVLAIYEIDKDGNTLWKKEIDNIYNSAYSELASNIEIKQSNNYLLIKTQKQVLYLDATGILKSDYIVQNQYCNNKNISFSANSDLILVSGQYITIDTNVMNYIYNNYIQRLNESQNIEWNHLTDQLLLDNSENNYITINPDSSIVTYYDKSSSYLWEFSSSSLGATIINCNNGITSATNIGGQLIITRTNNLGDY